MTEGIERSEEGSNPPREPLVPEVMEDIQGDPHLLAIFAQIVSAQFSPLPPAEQLERYDRLVPGSAKQILDDASAQTHHRMAQEAKVIGGNSKRSWVGLITAAIIEAGVIAGIVLAILKNESWTVPVFVAFGALPAGTYWVSQRRQRLERQGNDAPSQIPPPGSQHRPFEPR
jgi:uncharacterized membrane protein